ncbi:hypothetical protein [Wenzhouxiangella sp. AB-CW3]|uniref:hypothetical protein n=1 Tax=Wenzhouxiangella sp. AB-CW3 TaxID=2771012 RepID=UPI001CC2E11B|nr:hypothetical protein [Wenzhouxiangella sp. AB-CW3]
MIKKILNLTMLVACVSGCGWSDSSASSCSDAPCTADLVIKSAEFLVLESGPAQAAAVVRSADGFRVTMLGECAFGMFEGSRVRILYSADPPAWVKDVLNNERLPAAVVPEAIIAAEVRTRFNKDHEGVYMSNVRCFVHESKKPD